MCQQHLLLYWQNRRIDNARFCDFIDGGFDFFSLLFVVPGSNRQRPARTTNQRPAFGPREIPG